MRFYDSDNTVTPTKGNTVLLTDIIAITIALGSAIGLLIHSVRVNARLERDNAYLRNQVREMRKQIGNMVERPF